MTANGDVLRQRLRQRYQGVAEGGRAGLVRNLQTAAPVDTGDTYAGITGTMSAQGDRFRITLSNDVPQAKWTNDGTAPHVIRPRAKRALSFVTSGVRVITSVVHHPGTPATHWWDHELTAAKVSEALRRALAARAGR